jgi:charged multivesicular body protein 6
MGCLLSPKQASPPSRVNESDKVIAELKITRDKVKNYLKKLESTIAACQSCVKECIRNKQKDKAMLALRKQKYLEKNLETGRGELLNLEGQIVSIENAQIQKNVYEALKQGNDFLKSMNQQLTLQDVDKLMEETAEAIEYQQEVGRALAQQGIEENDEDLLQQLDQLDEKEALDYEIPAVPQKRLGKEEEVKHEKKQKKEKKVAMEVEV